MDREPKLRAQIPDFEKQKTHYFSHLALRLKTAMQLHKRFDLLERSDRGEREWGNVSEHCLMEATRTQALAKLLELSQKTTNDLVFAAAVHDVYKRKQMEKTAKGVSLTMKDYIDSEQESAQALSDAKISAEVIEYAGSVGSLPDNMKKIQAILNKGADVSEEDVAVLVMHYVDDYTRGSEWTNPVEITPEGKKINDLNRRLGVAFNNPKYTSIDEEGREYFDGKTSHEVQKAVGESVEEFLATIMTKRTGISIDPKELPTVIDEEIKKEIGNFRR